MQKKAFQKETEALHQIAQATEAIRRKHKLIKLGKESVEKVMSEALKPVVVPLEKLVTQSTEAATTKQKKRSKKVLKREWSPPTPHPSPPPLPLPPPPAAAIEEGYKTAFEDDEFLALPSANSSLNETLASPPLHSSSMKQTPLKSSTSAYRLESPDEPLRLLNIYLEQFSTKSPDLDTAYGVRQLKNEMKIGNTPVTFDEGTMNLGNQKYTLTTGLVELLFKKSPNMSFVTETDKSNYGTILRSTNAARKYYRTGEELRNDKSEKFKQIIEKLVKEKSGGGGGGGGRRRGASSLPQYTVASRKRPKMDYVYWDDPNELVDRLRLLMASQSAGNPSHTNEIMAIIEELREAGIIY